MSAARIDPTARIEDGATLGEGVEIGAFCTVGPHVVLEAGVKLISHVAVAGHTTIGANSVVYPFASLGFPPQSYHYKGEPSRLAIGRDCIIREHVTMNIGTAGGHMETVVGEGGMFMVGSHIAHDCVVGARAVFANNATLAGHVTVGENVFIGGLSAVHQFVRIGDGCIIGGMCGVRHDLIPFGAMVEGRPGLGGLNIIGLKRRGFSRPQIHALRAAYRELFYSAGTLGERTDRVAARFADDANVMHLIEFVRSAGKRRLTVPVDAADHVAEPEAA
ncbi:acyl-(acyl-carrier-protein)--UDP-N-acetylglucosamine O-acyltransferase [Ancylobacter novellus DSM 506]|uniref:Acyl-(Acyl-carrier-protein)--UDP-N-acetylglucosamine O-acyltransferase n=1 Tax=Ancylobacter novellus (strain ATCC 8093 / DSM 506 / JCM 20403 / CCM 1077 / IAM 12100 / NBRC 12443 / NCIMB 10456) TaxID=639283 RepID=D6ZYM0_ANCN5|nr:acyl-ACP--UDP-N-acetylglucosamine O-acyltransferase [Ancylobacter novellus]ADH89132.1 acyl-(acyl-carrier-protein)--UDP-N-acetylglucosamine O-acyltransferase [Ancylobacter novellus DSM 506]